MRNVSVSNKSPDGKTRRSFGNRPVRVRATISRSGVIRPATKTPVESVQNIDIKARLYNPQAAAEIRRLAAENAAKRGPFDPVAFDAFVTNHPLFLDLHLVVGEDED